MFDFDGDGDSVSDSDSLDEFIEYSIVCDDEEATCPSCNATIQLANAGTISCPGCGASIRVG